MIGVETVGSMVDRSLNHELGHIALVNALIRLHELLCELLFALFLDHLANLVVACLYLLELDLVSARFLF